MQYNVAKKVFGSGVRWAVLLAVLASAWALPVASRGAYVGWAVGEGVVIRSADDGNTWSSYLANVGLAPQFATFYAVTFADPMNGWIAGKNGLMYRTSNGGTNWTQQNSATTRDIRKVTFVDAQNGWAVGANGAIVHTTNGGTTWSAQSSGTTNVLFNVKFVDAQNGWAVGANGTILHTSNGGTNWNAQTSGTTFEMAAVSFVDVNNGWAVGIAQTFLKTNNGGSTWVSGIGPGGVWDGGSNGLTDVFFVTR